MSAKNILKNLALQRCVIKLIKLYQITISPDHSYLGKFFPFLKCRFYPSCSEYAIRAIEIYGFSRGLAMGIKRVLRCHPWNPGGFDEVTQIENE